MTLALPDFTDDDCSSPGDTFTAWAEFSFIMGASSVRRAVSWSSRATTLAAGLAEEMIDGIFARGIFQPAA